MKTEGNREQNGLINPARTPNGMLSGLSMTNKPSSIKNHKSSKLEEANDVEVESNSQEREDTLQNTELIIHDEANEDHLKIEDHERSKLDKQDNQSNGEDDYEEDNYSEIEELTNTQILHAESTADDRDKPTS